MNDEDEDHPEKHKLINFTKTKEFISVKYDQSKNYVTETGAKLVHNV